jgi:hypothetical protein
VDSSPALANRIVFIGSDDGYYYALSAKTVAKLWRFSTGYQPPPIACSEFEMRALRLRLTKETYLGSDKLRTWCEQNRNRCYIPEWLLDEWQIDVDPNISN